jgi:RNA processing factor Prp31
VKKIGDEVYLMLVDLKGLLTSATIVVVSVTASIRNGNPLPHKVSDKTLDICDWLALDKAKKKVQSFIENQMGYIAPNLSAIVESEVAAKLLLIGNFGVGKSFFLLRFAKVSLPKYL